MFIPFKISAVSLRCLGYDERCDYQRHVSDKEEHRKQLKNYLSGTDGIIDGDRLSKLWFPHGNYHVFISHSHADLNMAHFLASWLETNCGLKCFIDADVWDNAFDLLSDIDYTHCNGEWIGGKWRYDYDERNLSTSHVYSMLSIALMEAIDSIECPIFIDTTHSVPLKSAIQDKTLSPWIYEEINFMNKLPRKEPARLGNTRYFSKDNHTILLEKAHDSLKISHPIPTNGLVSVYSYDLNFMRGEEGTNSLDALYYKKFVFK